MGATVPRRGAAMFDHVALYVRDLETSRTFYEQALAPLGYGVAFEMEGMVAFGPGGQPESRSASRRGVGRRRATSRSRPKTMRRSTPSTRPRSRPAARTTARRGFASTTTRRITPPSFTTRMGTTSRPVQLAAVDWSFDPLSGEQRELRELVRTLARERIAPRAAEIDESHEFPWDVVELFREHGVFGLLFDEEWGGTGTGTLLALVAIEEVSKVCATSGLIVAVQELGSLGLKLAGTPGAEGALAAGARVGGDALCLRAHRGRLGLRLGGHAVDRAARRRRVRPRRVEAVHHERRRRRPLHGLREDRSRRRALRGYPRSSSRPTLPASR